MATRDIFIYLQLRSANMFRWSEYEWMCGAVRAFDLSHVTVGNF